MKKEQVNLTSQEAQRLIRINKTLSWTQRMSMELYTMLTQYIESKNAKLWAYLSEEPSLHAFIEQSNFSSNINNSVAQNNIEENIRITDNDIIELQTVIYPLLMKEAGSNWLSVRLNTESSSPVYIDNFNAHRFDKITNLLTLPKEVQKEIPWSSSVIIFLRVFISWENQLSTLIQKESKDYNYTHTYSSEEEFLHTIKLLSQNSGDLKESIVFPYSV